MIDKFGVQVRARPRLHRSHRSRGRGDRPGLAARRGEVVHHARRPLESLFGEVHLDRFAAAEAATKVYDFALDGALNLPAELYSLPVRQRVAEHARSVSMEKTVKGIDRTTGAHVPKRQVEELAVRAAHDFDAFYAQRPVVASLREREAMCSNVSVW